MVPHHPHKLRLPFPYRIRHPPQAAHYFRKALSVGCLSGLLMHLASPPLMLVDPILYRYIRDLRFPSRHSMYTAVSKGDFVQAASLSSWAMISEQQGGKLPAEHTDVKAWIPWSHMEGVIDACI